MNEIFQIDWRKKLNAFLHDSPDKPTDIATHEFRAAYLKALDQFTEAEKFDNAADWAASAADRLPFPSPSKLRQPFDELTELRHPMGGSSLPCPKFASTTEAFEVSSKTRPFLYKGEDPQTAFLCAWRFWRNWASAADSRFPFLPADTRIPDHTIWHHLSITSAFQGCQIPSEKNESGKFAKTFSDHAKNPRLLLFSLGPVQDFIASARSTRDLWSGSYLLSYLISSALGKIAQDLGPDHVIFPNLLDQPLLDLQLKKIFSGPGFSEKTIWEGFRYEDENLPKLLTPSLPNRFLALLPATLPEGISCEDYAAAIANHIQETLTEIATGVAAKTKELSLEFNEARFKEQTVSILDLHWQTLAIPGSFDEVWQQANGLLPKDEENYTPRTPIEAIKKMMEKENCHPQYPPSPTSAWGLLNALIQWLHDGTKAHRNFEAWSTGEWQSGKEFNKDNLNGKEEVVLTSPDNEAAAEKLGPKIGMSRGTFKANELLGASTLIKRLWWLCYLPENIGITPDALKKRHPMPNTHAIAKGEPFADSDEFEETEGESYFAILALDGDEMGQWISGSKSPQMRDCLSPNAIEFYEKNAPEFLNAPRAVTPSWHLQFSEALGNFSFHCAQRIVEAFDGRLLYAGGDDVLAMLPAKDALACARALRAAFRGEKDYLNTVKGVLTGQGKARHSDRATQLFQIDIEKEGYLRLHPNSGAKYGANASLLSDPVTFPILLPGPATDVSVGIAIAHQKSPLQDVVRAAQIAEKRAKNQLGRAAVAITIMKRSDEILEWGCKWSLDEKKTEDSATQEAENRGSADKEESPNKEQSKDSAGYRLLYALITDLTKGELNARFPYKLEALLTPYLQNSEAVLPNANFDSAFPDLLLKEVQHVLSRNNGGSLGEAQKEDFSNYWAEISALKDPEEQEKSLTFDRRLQLLINLLRTAAWSTKSKSDDTTYSLAQS